jgi:hypothetical protein
MIRLSALGIAPGATVELRQRRPAAVVRVEHTEVALADQILEQVWVNVPEAADANRVDKNVVEQRESSQRPCANAGLEACHAPK